MFRRKVSVYRGLYKIFPAVAAPSSAVGCHFLRVDELEVFIHELCDFALTRREVEARIARGVRAEDGAVPTILLSFGL